MEADPTQVVNNSQSERMVPVQQPNQDIVSSYRQVPTEQDTGASVADVSIGWLVFQ